MPDGTKLAEFVAWCQKHVTGDEKGDAQLFLDRLFQAFGHVPATKVLMLSVHDDEVYVEEATKSGAMGYLVKHTAVNSLCRAIREVHKGKTFFKPSLPGHLHKLNRKK